MKLALKSVIGLEHRWARKTHLVLGGGGALSETLGVQEDSLVMFMN